MGDEVLERNKNLNRGFSENSSRKVAKALRLKTI